MRRNQQAEGHWELYTYPKALEKTKEDKQIKKNKNLKRIVILGLNNFNGQNYPQRFELKSSLYQDKNRFLYSGGISAIKSYVDIIKEKYPHEVLFVDAGSFLNPKREHKKTIFFYNYLGLDVVNLGRNEFNLKTPYRYYSRYLADIFREAKFDILSSNIFDLYTSRAVHWPFLRSRLIKEINGIKVGFIGVHSHKLAQKNNTKKLKGIYFQNMAKEIILESNRLKNAGAKVIILLANHGVDCTRISAENLDLPIEKVNFEPKNLSSCESTENELIKTLSILPPGKIDLVVSSGKKSKVANFIYNIPVIQNYGQGHYLSWAEIYYNTKHHYVDPDKTKIHQPIQLCHQFLEGPMDCYLEKEDKTREIIPAKFLGEKINIQPLPSF